ncbi:MAG TPA: hypothetical protein VHZ24_16170 [Pirellulales bacterium]|jgi:hypothetical protein|nr:hypothetical protein [Pirellulales bacterium]
MNAAQIDLALPAHNPFSATRVRPGQIPFRFAEGASVGQLTARFQAAGCRGQIVGPHGSGKSTLLATLLEALRARQRRVTVFTLRNHERRLPAWPAWLRVPHTGGPPSIVAIDGYEQLSRWSAWRVVRFCRRNGHGLLVTTHRACKLPLLYATRPELAAILELVTNLLPAGDNHVTPADVEVLFARHAPDVRETLFGLYRLYELRRRGLQRP